MLKINFALQNTLVKALATQTQIKLAIWLNTLLSFRDFGSFFTANLLVGLQTSKRLIKIRRCMRSVANFVPSATCYKPTLQ